MKNRWRSIKTMQINEKQIQIYENFWKSRFSYRFCKIVRAFAVPSGFRRGHLILPNASKISLKPKETCFWCFCTCRKIAENANSAGCIRFFWGIAPGFEQNVYFLHVLFVFWAECLFLCRRYKVLGTFAAAFTFFCRFYQVFAAAGAARRRV